MAVKIMAEYIGDSRVKLEHGPSRDRIITDLPVDNGGKGRKFSPSDLLAASLSSCILTIMSKVAQKENVNFCGCTIETEKYMKQSPRMVEKLKCIIRLKCKVPANLKQKFLACVKTCPVHRSLHPDIRIEFEIKD